MSTTNVLDASNIVELINSNSKLRISKFGGHIISWKINDNELLWISKCSVMDCTNPIRGGIPICFPQFADNGPLKLHGFARETVWNVVDDNDNVKNKVIMELLSSSNTKSIWNYDFILRLTIELLESSLVMTMTVINPSNDIPFDFSTCFHTYFKTLNSNRISLLGLENLGYIDKPDQRKEKVEGNEAIVLQTAVNESNGQLDRIYRNAPSVVELKDTSTGAVYTIEKSTSITDYVVFNPGINGKRGTADFDEDGYKYMFCVEPAIAVGNYTINPLQTWTGTQTISYKKDDSIINSNGLFDFIQ